MDRVRDAALPSARGVQQGTAAADRAAVRSHEAGVLASAASLRVNLLHLSSAESMERPVEIRGLYPELDIRAETTLHHLCLTYDMLEGPAAER